MVKHENPAVNSETPVYVSGLWSPTSMVQEPLWLLGELTSELSAAMDLATLQRILARKIRWILDFDRCTLAVRFQPLDTEYLIFELTNPSQAESSPPQTIPLAEGWPGKVLTDSKPYFLDDLTQLPPLVTPPTTPHWGIISKACSLMLLPLRFGNDTVGSLNFSSKQPHAYSTSWRNLMSLLATQIGGQLGCILAHQRTASALEALRSSQAELKTAYEFQARVLESANEAIYTTDLEGNLTLVNHWITQTTGYYIEELLGVSFLKLFTPEQTTELQKHFLATVRQGAIIDLYETELIKKDGGKVTVTLSLAPLLSNEKVFAVVGTAQDITERKQAEACRLALERAAQLEEQIQELQRLNRLKDEFLSTISHELRTPLTNMKMAIVMLKTTPSEERRENYLQILDDECIRETNLINDLLDWQRLDTGAKPFLIETIQIQSWLPQVLTSFLVRMQKHQQRFHLDIQPALLPLVSDRNSLERIVIELLSNACKYTSPGGEIGLKVQQYSGSTLITEFSVYNSGTQIPSSETKRIFEKFYRIPSNDSWEQGGTGLGLALVQKLVEQLSGTITVQSQDQYNTFIVQVPSL